MVTYHELVSIKELQKSLKTIYFGTAINHEKKKKRYVLSSPFFNSCKSKRAVWEKWVEETRLSFCLNC